MSFSWQLRDTQANARRLHDDPPSSRFPWRSQTRLSLGVQGVAVPQYGTVRSHTRPVVPTCCGSLQNAAIFACGRLRRRNGEPNRTRSAPAGHSHRRLWPVEAERADGRPHR